MNAVSPLSAVTSSDPYPYYALLVAERPFYFDDSLGMWVATSARAVEALLLSRRLRTRPIAEPVPLALVGTSPGDVFSRMIRMTDGDAAATAREAVLAALSTVGVKSVTDAAQSSAQWLLVDRSLDDPETLAAFLFTLPALTIATLLGFSSGAREHAGNWTRGFVRSISAGATSGDISGGVAATALMEAALDTVLRDDVDMDTLYAKLIAECRARGIDDAAGTANAIGLLFQTYDATPGLAGNTLKHLAACDNHARAAKSAALPGVIAEVARYDSPVQNTRRYAGTDVDILGETIRKDAAILVVLAAANRDPAANPQPDRFDSSRKDRRTYTFGMGAHACPGGMLAATIAHVAVATLLDKGLDVDVLRHAGYLPYANVRVPDFRGIAAGTSHRRAKFLK